MRKEILPWYLACLFHTAVITPLEVEGKPCGTVCHLGRKYNERLVFISKQNGSYISTQITLPHRTIFPGIFWRAGGESSKRRVTPSDVYYAILEKHTYPK